MIDPPASARRFRFASRALGWVLAALLRLLAATWRIDAAASARLTGDGDTPRLVGFWHGKYFALLVLLRGVEGCVLVGAGFRGEVIAAICETLGYTAILLPRGDRERALEQIRAALRRNPLCATALDGPVGPARRVKPSLLHLIAEVGGEILPVSVVSSPRLVLGWRWDRREIPLPLSRVRLAVGEPVAIPKAVSGQELEAWQRRVGDRVDELDRIPAVATATTQLDRGSALLLVDIQRDFCAGGALAVPDGDAVVPVANRWIEQARAQHVPVIASRDWHPAHHASFRERGGPWPPHCVQGTSGAEFHPELHVPADALVVSKGSEPDNDSYSDFDRTGLAERLRALGVERLFIGGLALEYCVRATVLDAIADGFEVHLLLDATRALEVHPGDADSALAEMTRAGAAVVANAR